MQIPICHSRRLLPTGESERFFCAHPQVFATDSIVSAMVCRICDRWQQPEPRTFRPMPANPLTSRVGPCGHLGAEVGLRECPSCGGNVKLKVFECRHPAHSDTTLRECQVCPDYVPTDRREPT